MTPPFDDHPVSFDAPVARPAKSAARATVAAAFEDEDAGSGVLGFARRHAPAVGAGLAAVLVIGGAVSLIASGDDTPPPRRVQEFTVVTIAPPPPPPPPPPPEVQPPPEPQMTEMQPIVEPEIKQEAPVDEPNEAPPSAADEPPPSGPLGMDKAAEGPGDRFGLVGRPGGRGFLNGGGGGGSRWAGFVGAVQQQIEAALRANPKTRGVEMQVRVRLWADATGRVHRVQLVSSTGNAEIDAAVRDEALASLTLRTPPPADMPMPVVARITLRRPS